MHDRHTGGFSMVEVLVAMVLVAGAVAGLASLGVLGLAQGDASHRAGQALALAQGKVDELRSATWGFDANGAPQSDPSLALTAPLTLTGAGTGAVDFFDRFSQSVASPSDAAFRRRWAVMIFDAGDPHTLLLQACVESVGSVEPGTSRQCVVTLRTRHP
jgi:Tfp pilus assembly protein PilV